ncbi:UNVERIFIED_CONTAM: hypothetical protein Sindi_0962300 [Sesamum indicum]
MIAQELFSGYHQSCLPPRCALKVGIRKAYDSVEWDFLVAVFELFGFPPTFIRWIEECVTTPSFSVGLNGKPHGFFSGARGLRQGDPLSPYLFVLVMEVLHLEYLQMIDQDGLFSFHWKCDSAQIFQLGFADDLLLFCRADMNSIGVLKRGLDRFAVWSGLRLNVQKSHLIILRSAQGLREEMLEALGFQVGLLPLRYLGLPLLSSRLTIADCQPLLVKIDKRIAGWEGMALSYAGRGSTNSGYAKKLCDIIQCDRTSIWVEWLYHDRLRDTSIWTIREHGVGGNSYLYGSFSVLWWTTKLEMGGSFIFGRTRGITSDLLLRHFHVDRGSLDLRSQQNSAVISGGEWQWPLITDFEF